MTRRFFVVGALLLALTLPLRAQELILPVGEAFAHEVLTASTVAVALTDTVYAPANQPSAKSAIISVETDAIRYMVHGGTPTTSTGHKVATDKTFVLHGIGNLIRFRMIKVTNDATVRITYLR